MAEVAQPPESWSLAVELFLSVSSWVCANCGVFVRVSRC